MQHLVRKWQAVLQLEGCHANTETQVWYGSMVAFRAFFLLVVLGVGLSACASNRPVALFDLKAPDPVSVRDGTQRQLLVPKPVAVAAYDNERIVVRSGDLALEYFPDAQWADNLPGLLQARLVESFEKTGQVRAVGVPGQGLRIDAQIVTEIRHFEIDVSGSGTQARVGLFVKLMNDANGRIWATKHFEAVVPASTDSVEAGTAALNAAFGAVAVDIVAWTLTIL
jgi:cholesterol transport system auxiliary component